MGSDRPHLALLRLLCDSYIVLSSPPFVGRVIKYKAMKNIPIFVLLMAGCSMDEKVYVPGENFYQKIELTASKYEVKVGEPLSLFVSRETDGWIAKSKSEVEVDQPGICWLKSEPPKHERDVSFNISFKVAPPSSHEFDVGMKAVSGRSVMFNSPGKHTIVGMSSFWCSPGIISNQIEIMVRY